MPKSSSRIIAPWIEINLTANVNNQYKGSEFPCSVNIKHFREKIIQNAVAVCPKSIFIKSGRLESLKTQRYCGTLKFSCCPG